MSNTSPASTRLGSSNVSETDHDGFVSHPQIILLGDSITQWSTMTVQAWLQTRYSRRADIINRGYGGYTAPHGLQVLRKVFPRHDTVKAVFIFFGANDACCSVDKPQTPQVSIDEYTTAITEMIKHIEAASPQTKVILVTPPAVDEYKLPHDRLTAGGIAQYASAVRRIAETQCLPLVDCWGAFLRYAGWNGDRSSPVPGSKAASRNENLGSLLQDGVHFSTQGYVVLFHEFIRILDEQLPELAPEKMPIVLALDQSKYVWDDLGATNQIHHDGYPITDAERSRASALQASLEKSMGMTIEEFFGISKGDHRKENGGQ